MVNFSTSLLIAHIVMLSIQHLLFVYFLYYLPDVVLIFEITLYEPLIIIICLTVTMTV